jgi:hypothetical protein
MRLLCRFAPHNDIKKHYVSLRAKRSNLEAQSRGAKRGPELFSLFRPFSINSYRRLLFISLLIKGTYIQSSSHPLLTLLPKRLLTALTPASSGETPQLQPRRAEAEQAQQEGSGCGDLPQDRMGSTSTVGPCVSDYVAKGINVHRGRRYVSSWQVLVQIQITFCRARPPQCMPHVARDGSVATSDLIAVGDCLCARNIKSGGIQVNAALGGAIPKHSVLIH